MTENEAIKEIKCWLNFCFGSRIAPELVQAARMATEALKEVQQYKKHGITVESALNNMCDLAAAENLIEEYRAIGTLEELKAAMKYVYLAKKHGTVGQVIENCVKYEEIGTPEECLRNKDFLDFISDKMNPNDFETYLRLYNALEEKGCEG